MLNTDFTLGNCMFGSVKVTKNADPDKYAYTGYGIGSVEKISLILELIWAHLCILITRKKVS